MADIIDEDEFCFTAAEPTQIDTAGLYKNQKPKCYNSGYKAKRKPLIGAIESLSQLVGQTLTENKTAFLDSGLYQNDQNFRIKGQEYTNYVTAFEIRYFCKWSRFSLIDCNREFRKIVDMCNTKGENGKQGVAMEGDCIK